MNNLQKLTNIVRTKIHGEGWEPELEFGCRIKCYSDDDLVINSFNDNTLFIQASSNYDGGFRQQIYKHEVEEVYGKPLTLREILLALQKTEHKDKYTFDFSMEGSFMLFRVYGKIGVIHLNLSKEPKDYHEETLESLIDLLS